MLPGVIHRGFVHSFRLEENWRKRPASVRSGQLPLLVPIYSQLGQRKEKYGIHGLLLAVFISLRDIMWPGRMALVIFINRFVCGCINTIGCRQRIPSLLYVVSLE